MRSLLESGNPGGWELVTPGAEIGPLVLVGERILDVFENIWLLGGCCRLESE